MNAVFSFYCSLPRYEIRKFNMYRMLWLLLTSLVKCKTEVTIIRVAVNRRIFIIHTVTGIVILCETTVLLHVIIARLYFTL